MGVDEATSQAFLQDLLNAQQRSNTGTTVNRRDPNLFYTRGRRVQTQSTFRDYDIETGGPPKTKADDRTQTGSVKDVYGIRRSSDKPDDPGRRPTEVPPSKTPLDLRQNVSEKQKEIIKRSLEISEDRRRARIEGRR